MEQKQVILWIFTLSLIKYPLKYSALILCKSVKSALRCSYWKSSWKVSLLGKVKMILILLSFVFVVYFPSFYLYKVILYPTYSISIMECIIMLDSLMIRVLETIIGFILPIIIPVKIQNDSTFLHNEPKIVQNTLDFAKH